MLPNKPRGVPRVNDRRVLNGIFWMLRSGAPWRDHAYYGLERPSHGIDSSFRSAKSRHVVDPPISTAVPNLSTQKIDIFRQRLANWDYIWL
jgi:hypothetical protein